VSGLKEMKCPHCGGSIKWSATANSIRCDFCGTEFDAEALESYDVALEEDFQDEINWSFTNSQWQEGEEENLKAFLCESCGGQIIVEANMGATACPYCGNPVVVPAQFRGDLRPDFVIPFRKTKEDAKEALRKHLSNKKFLPKVFSNENHIDEIKGIYVPFWLFDAEAQGRGRYIGRKERKYKEGNTEYTETKYYSVVRSGRLCFDNVAIDGSSNIADDLMESIEPFDFDEAVPFGTGYLSGYMADRYDIDSDTTVLRANERIVNSTEKAIRDSVKGYDSVEAQRCSVKLNNARAKYALYPVWLLNTSWQGERYTFAMNGQTGKFVGNLPKDKGAYRKSLVFTWAIVSLVAFAALVALWFAGHTGWNMPYLPYAIVSLVVGGVVSLIRNSIHNAKLTSVRFQDQAVDYIRKGSFGITGSSDAYLYSRTTSRNIGGGSAAGAALAGAAAGQAKQSKIGSPHSQKVELPRKDIRQQKGAPGVSRPEKQELPRRTLPKVDAINKPTIKPKKPSR